MMRSSFKLWVTFWLCLAQAVSFADTQITSQQPHYDWGRGLSIPQSNLNLGGYLSGSFKHLQTKKNSAALDDLSLFISWSPYDRVRFFSEIELEDWLSTETGIHLSDALRVERLYVDLFASESLSVRLGKFLTPFGYWNVIHAAPLVWTTTRPLTTEEHLFPSHVTGLMLNKSFSFNEQNLDVSVYLDDSRDFDVHRDRIDFNQALGVRIEYEFSEPLHAGFSYLEFTKRISKNYATNHLFGLDFLWKKNDYELQMELSYRHAHDFQRNETNFYLQAVAPLFSQSHLYAIARYEYLSGYHEVNTTIFPSHTHLGVAALAWRPFTPLILKAEYRFGSGNSQVAPSGFFTSISTLF